MAADPHTVTFKILTAVLMLHDAKFTHFARTDVRWLKTKKSNVWDSLLSSLKTTRSAGTHLY